jgi:centromeric protein E
MSTAGIIIEGDAEDEDSLGDGEDGLPSQSIQIKALQAELADKNRYNQALEKQLLQACRSSHSRILTQFSPRFSSHDKTSTEIQLREKDTEIAKLRAYLDDKDRMVSALRSAVRNREKADLSLNTTVNRSSSGNITSSGGSGAKSGKSSTTSPVGVLTPTTPANPRKTKSVDEMTQLLDEMITERVQSGNTQVDRSGSSTSRSSTVEMVSYPVSMVMRTPRELPKNFNQTAYSALSNRFSLRTKTGCFNCHRRNVKCDETEPACKFSYTQRYFAADC